MIFLSLDPFHARLAAVEEGGSRWTPTVAAWARALWRVQLSIIGLVLLVLGYCAWAIVSDAMVDDEEWDGLGVLVGVWLGATAMVALVIATCLAALTRRGLRRSDQRHVGWSAAFSALIALAWLLGSWQGAVHPGADPGWVLTLLAPGLVLLPVSAGSVVEVLNGRRATDPEATEPASSGDV